MRLSRWKRRRQHAVLSLVCQEAASSQVASRGKRRSWSAYRLTSITPQSPTKRSTRTMAGTVLCVLPSSHAPLVHDIGRRPHQQVAPAGCSHFGTKANPVVIESFETSRIMACPGACASARSQPFRAVSRSAVGRGRVRCPWLLCRRPDLPYFPCCADTDDTHENVGVQWFTLEANKLWECAECGQVCNTLRHGVHWFRVV